MERITNKQLQNKVDYLNKKLNRPLTRGEYRTSDTGARYWFEFEGNIYIDHHNPGGSIYQYKLSESRLEFYGVNSGIGAHEWTSYRMTRKEFYAYLTGMLDLLQELQYSPFYKTLESTPFLYNAKLEHNL